MPWLRYCGRYTFSCRQTVLEVMHTAKSVGYEGLILFGSVRDKGKFRRSSYSVTDSASLSPTLRALQIKFTLQITEVQNRGEEGVTDVNTSSVLP